MKVLLIPVKDPEFGKTRLAEFLSQEERRQLSWAMFDDVSKAAAGAETPDKVVVVTNFQPAVNRARSQGWKVLIEDRQLSESASVDWASKVLAEQGVDVVMRLPADIPLVKPADIDDLLSTELTRPAALLVPSRDGTGTNCIIRTPADLFPSRFGPNSLSLHHEEAFRVGVSCTVVNNPRIGLDIDDVSDLRAFMEDGQGTGTYALLSRMGNRIQELGFRS